LIDYEAFCGVSGDGATSEMDIDPEVLKRRLDAGEEILLLDVREPYEREIVRLVGDKWIPLGELPARLGEVAKAHEVVAYCHQGTRSRDAARLLRGAGHAKAQSLAGGIDAWAARIDTTLLRY
jgi:adenylyltransferase/sulfurtransferase